MAVAALTALAAAGVARLLRDPLPYFRDRRAPLAQVAEDSTVIGTFNPFLFFEFALIVPHIALAASEGAPSVLPAGTTPVRYDGAGPAAELMRAEIRTTALLEASLTSVSGRWSNARVAAYPDSMPLGGWQYGCPRARGTDVRGNHRPVPAGVTLGEVRRGWRGSCD